MKLYEVLSFAADGSFDKVYQLIQNSPLDYFESTGEFVEYMNDQLQQAKIPFRFKEVDHPPRRIQWGRVGIYGGEYDPNDYMMHLKVLKPFLMWLKRDPESIMQVLYKIYVHEKVHQEQHKRALSTTGHANIFAPKGDTHKDYLSHPQEIAAMAAEIIAELHAQGSSNERIKQAVIKNDTLLLQSERYMEFMLHQPDKKVFRRLFKTMITMLS